MTALSFPAPGPALPAHVVESLRRLYGLDGLTTWAASYPAGTKICGLRSGKECTALISRRSAESCRDPAIPWYSALELLADELRVDVDRGAIKAEVLRVLREAAG